MKLNRLETHDRLLHFNSQDFDIGKTCQEIINSRPFGDHAFYIFCHKRQIGLDERWDIFNRSLIQNPSTRFEDVPTDRMIWQPRLTKPVPQENSMLFKGYPGTDNIKVIWMIPAPELWDQFEKGKMTENKMVWESIHEFKTNKERMGQREDDDLSDMEISKIYESISRQAKGFKILTT